MGTAHPNDDLLETEAELDRRTAHLLLTQVEEAFEDCPTECLDPDEHERMLAIAEDVSDLKDDISE